MIVSDGCLLRMVWKNWIRQNKNPIHVELGQALFFDRILSGNRDTACTPVITL